MARLASALALILLATTADARTAVVLTHPKFWSTGSYAAAADQFGTSERDVASQAITGLLDRLGGTYDVYSGTDLSGAPFYVGEMLRQGRIVLNWGRKDSLVRNYDCVIHAIFSTSGGASNLEYWPDSVCLTVGYPRVPQILIGSQSGSTGNNFTPVSETTGVAIGSGALLPGNGGPFYSLRGGGGTIPFRRSADLLIAMENGLAGHYRTNPAGFRMLVPGHRATARWYNYNFIRGCTDCDSLYIGASPVDTGTVWVKLNQDRKITNQPYSSAIISAAPTIFCAWGEFPSSTYDVASLAIALAYADSVTGGKVFDSPYRRPLRVGIQIRGGWSRTNTNIAGGFPWTDSSVVKACIDSIASLRVPFAVGVNVESLAAYPQDKTWWMRAAPYVKFAPYNTAGVRDTTNLATTLAGGGGVSSWQLPRDALGRNRVRAFYGDGSCVGSDTSLWCLMRAQYWKLDSAFGDRMVDHALIPVLDDWSPRQFNGYNYAGQESLISMLASAGVKNIVTNVQSRNSSPAWTKQNVYGLTNVPGTMRVQLGRLRNSYMPILATAGYDDSGAVFRDVLVDAGMATQSYPSYTRGDQQLRGALTGIGRGWQANYRGIISNSANSTKNYAPDTLTLEGPSVILTIHASELGSGAGYTAMAYGAAAGQTPSEALPTRPGWWMIKNYVNSIKAINAQAGKTLIEIVYPEEIYKP